MRLLRAPTRSPCRLGQACKTRRPHRQTRSLGTATTINPEEISHFSRLSSQWWDEQGEFGLLHKMNLVRVQFMRDKLLEIARDEESETEVNRREGTINILEGCDVLDVGCGGGLLSESLARLGAKTLGIDASASNIAIARLHASMDPTLSEDSATEPSTSRTSSSLLAPKHNLLEYRHSSAEELLNERKQFDVVCSMEVLEHVDNPDGFLRSCAELVKPGGHLFLSTISRTPFSYLLTIFAAEHLLRLVAPGTHTYSKFIKPSELLDFFSKPLTETDAKEAGSGRVWITRLYDGQPTRREAEIRGTAYLPWKGEWVLMRRGGWWTTECNYLFWARKPLNSE